MKAMKRLAGLLAALAMLAAPTGAAAADGVYVASTSVDRIGEGLKSSIDVKVDFDLSKATINDCQGVYIETLILTGGKPSSRFTGKGSAEATDTVKLGRVYIINKTLSMLLRRAGKVQPDYLVLDKDAGYNVSNSMALTPANAEGVVCVRTGTYTVNRRNLDLVLDDASMPLQELRRYSFKYQKPKVVLHYVEPAAQKVRMSMTDTIYFEENKSALDNNYLGNRAGLKELRAMLAKGPESIRVTAHMPPVAGESAARALCEARNKAMIAYIKKYFAQANPESDVVSPDWATLEAWVKNSSIAGKDSMLTFFRQTPVEGRYAKFRHQFPAQCSFMDNFLYQRLNFVEVTIGYMGDGMTDGSKIEAIYDDPDKRKDLSALDLYNLARYYKVKNDTKRQLDVIVYSGERFKNDPQCQINAANAYMARGDYERAWKSLEKAGDSADAEYARGVFSVLTEDYATALDYYQKAADKGLAMAREELGKLKTYLE